MKSDQTNHFLLGVIATGVTALTILALERRYYVPIHKALDGAGDTLNRAQEEARVKLSRAQEEARMKAGRISQKVREGASAISERAEEGVETLRDKASELKTRIAGSSNDKRVSGGDNV